MHTQRHPHLNWQQITGLLNSQILTSIAQMESTGGEPDVISPTLQDSIVIMDCSPESPAGRRSLCFDLQALEKRKANKPQGSAVQLATEMGVELLTESDYAILQSVGEFDLKTSSWIATPIDVRALGGALFGDRRFGRVFTYHNGADSYYAARGFRAKITLS
jgi:hypothetical protein